MKQLLVIDDDRELCSLLSDYLEPEGFACHFAHSGPDGIEQAMARHWDLIVLDIMLPGKNGFEVLATLRAFPATTDIPLIMLTARGNDVDLVVGLEMGADDYLAKPFNPRELLARLRAVLRRAEKTGTETSPSLSAVNDVILNEKAYFVTVAGEKIELTGVECKLLALLLENPGTLIPRERLSKQGLGRAFRPFDRSLDMHISRIRKKLGPAPDGSERIKSIRGEGYVYAISNSIQGNNP